MKVLDLFRRRKARGAPLIIIQKDCVAANTKEYKSIEDAISDLETDPNVPLDKIEKLKISLKQLKNKTSITFRNGKMQ